ncbi:MAG: SAM hydrolase/SAM-dependent halogenase family protein [Woeseiaceae bacterium]
MTSIKPSGVITITTDFGHKGPFAAVMKGVILERFRQACIVDLAHDIPAYWPPEAGFWISRSYRYFPAGTVHIAIVDPGVGTGREIIVVEYDRHIFMAPDNGLLASMLGSAEGAVVYQLQQNALARLRISRPSLTFHGRDIFAPIAAEFAAGRVKPSDVGSRTDQWTPAWLDEPAVTPGRVAGVIVTVDAFGNLISNIDQSLLVSFKSPVASLAGHRFDMKPTYGNVKPGDYLALINSFGVLEIARAEGSAAASLGTERGAPIAVLEA